MKVRTGKSEMFYPSQFCFNLVRNRRNLVECRRVCTTPGMDEQVEQRKYRRGSSVPRKVGVTGKRRTLCGVSEDDVPESKREGKRSLQEKVLKLCVPGKRNLQ